MNDEELRQYRVVGRRDVTILRPLGDALEEVEVCASSATAALTAFRRHVSNHQGYFDWPSFEEYAGISGSQYSSIMDAAMKTIAFREPYYSARTSEEVSYQKVFHAHLLRSRGVLENFCWMVQYLVYEYMRDLELETPHPSYIRMITEAEDLASWIYEAVMLEFLVKSGYDAIYPVMVLNDQVIDLMEKYKYFQMKHSVACLFVPPLNGYGKSEILPRLVELHKAGSVGVYPAMIPDALLEELTEEERIIKKRLVTSANPPVLLSGGSQVVIQHEISGIAFTGGILPLRNRKDQWELHVRSCCNARGVLVINPLQTGFKKDSDLYYPEEVAG
jgi:hypothetical protein